MIETYRLSHSGEVGHVTRRVFVKNSAGHRRRTEPKKKKAEILLALG